MPGKDIRKNQARKHLSSAWEPRLGLNGRIYYYSLHSQTVQILPPPESWSCAYDLPYGWEIGLDYADKLYFINHVTQQVTYSDPRSGVDKSNCDDDSLSTSSDYENPAPRQYTIERDQTLGFGFIAGSEKPVIIRSVSPGGPSENKLLPGDQIIKIGSQYVKSSDREVVIELIRDSDESVNLTVIQPTRVANSSFLKPNKKLMKGMHRPRVRFADDNSVSGEENEIGSSPLLTVPGTLRVLLEEGQSRSFQFSSETTAGDVVAALCEKLGIVDSKLYSLVLSPHKTTGRLSSNRSIRNRASDEILIAPWDCIAKVVNNPSVKHHECRFRLTFVSKDIHQLSRDDPRSFRYHYVQCVNDVVAGDVFFDEITVDERLRLASFQMLEVFIGQFSQETVGDGDQPVRKKSFRAPNKITLKQIEKEYGLARFLSPNLLSLLNSHQSKEYRKSLQQQLKTNFANFVLNSNGGGQQRPSSPPPTPSSQRHVSVDELLHRIRMQYVKILSPHHLYAGRYFDATILAVIESDITLIVGHHYGISQLVNSKTKMASIFADFTCVTSVEVAPCSPEASKTNVRVEFKEMGPLVLSMHPQSAQNFAQMVSGYCRVYDNNDLMLTLPIQEGTTELEYFSCHKVKVSDWNYPPEESEEEDYAANSPSSFFYCDFSEPIRSSLLSDQIPISVRSMFQQSKVDSSDNNDSMDDVDEKIQDERIPSSFFLPPPGGQRVTDDEGVALSHTDVSPVSSNSTLSSSPSSGIGSVISHPDVSPDAKVSDDDEGEWSELMDAITPNCDKIKLEIEKEKKEINEVQQDNDQTGEIRRESVSSLHENTITNDATISEEHRIDDKIDVSNNASNPEEETNQSSPELDCLSITSSAIEEESIAPEESSPLPPQPMKRHRFSSFKPDENQDNNSSPTSPHDADPQARNTLTSDQLKDHLVRSSLAIDKDVEEEEEGQVTSEEPAAMSPLPVNDLASGHKSLSKKRKNRLSWFNKNDSLPRSYSLDTGLSAPREESKKKSFFRRVFSPSRTYSVKKNKSTSSSSLNRDAMPGNKRNSRWSLFRSTSEDSPRAKSKFSFFRLFSRNKRRHTVNITSRDIGTPLASDNMNSGMYSVFNPATSSEPEDSDSVLKRAASVEEVQMRPRERGSANQRPVSFMTFQQLPVDFSVKRSSSKSSSMGESASPKSATFHLPDPHLAIKVQTPISEEADRQKDFDKTSMTASEKLPSPIEHGYENWGNLTPPTKPIRSSILENNDRNESEEQSGEITETEPPTPKRRVDTFEEETTVVRRRAPSPPKQPPPTQQSPEYESLSDDDSQPEDDRAPDNTIIYVEKLNLGDVVHDDESEGKPDIVNTPDRRSNGSEGSLVGEIMAYWNNDADEKESETDKGVYGTVTIEKSKILDEKVDGFTEIEDCRLKEIEEPYPENAKPFDNGTTIEDRVADVVDLHLEVEGFEEVAHELELSGREKCSTEGSRDIESFDANKTPTVFEDSDTIAELSHGMYPKDLEDSDEESDSSEECEKPLSGQVKEETDDDGEIDNVEADSHDEPISGNRFNSIASEYPHSVDISSMVSDPEEIQLDNREESNLTPTSKKGVDVVPDVVIPDGTEPEGTEPDVTEPDVVIPDVTDPNVTDPNVTDPNATDPDGTEPDVTEPDVTEPDVTETDVIEPDITVPDVIEPDEVDPDVVVKPNVATSAAVTSDNVIQNEAISYDCVTQSVTPTNDIQTGNVDQLTIAESDSITLSRDISKAPDAAVVATETVASGNDVITSTWSFAASPPQDYLPPPQQHSISKEGLPADEERLQNSSESSAIGSPPFPKIRNLKSNGFGENSESQVESSPSKLHYSLLVTPRLFGQRNEKKTFSKIKMPTLSPQRPKASHPAPNGPSRLSEDIGYDTAKVRSPKPALPPKPSFL